MKALAVSAALETGLTFGTVRIQSGMDEIGSRAPLVNGSGRFSRLTTTRRVSHFAIRTAVAVKRLAKLNASGNITEKTPRRSRALNPDDSLKPGRCQERKR